MEPIKPPKNIKIYQLLKQSGMMFSSATSIGASNLGCGFFVTLQEAEHHRTMEILKETSNPKPKFYIFELEVPNPAYEE